MSTEEKKSVLIVEDDPFLIKAYQVKFEKEDIDTWLAIDGDDVANFLEKDPPSAVVLDLMLPGISGFDILEKIRKHSKWKNVPVIILSNLGQAQDIERGKSLGANDYIIKTNVKINEVVEKIKEYF